MSGANATKLRVLLYVFNENIMGALIHFQSMMKMYKQFREAIIDNAL
jgi:hypothetical protein